jgi:hypothetical protein
MVGILRGPDGKMSMMRFASFTVVSVIMSVFLAHNIVAMINGLGFVGIGFQEATLIATVLGAKAAQTFGESKGIERNNHSDSKTLDEIPMDKTQ